MSDIDNWPGEYAEIMAADWRSVPRGYYAFEVIADDLDMDDPHFCQVLGYKLWERRRNGWHRSYRIVAGGDPGRVEQYLRDEESGDPKFDRQMEIHALLDPEFAAMCRETFGKLTGRCGCCGRTLSDPDSKMRGIGPDCWAAVSA